MSGADLSTDERYSLLKRYELLRQRTVLLAGFQPNDKSMLTPALEYVDGVMKAMPMAPRVNTNHLAMAELLDDMYLLLCEGTEYE